MNKHKAYYKMLYLKRYKSELLLLTEVKQLLLQQIEYTMKLFLHYNMVHSLEKIMYT